jgi:hypothetical protein
MQENKMLRRIFGYERDRERGRGRENEWNVR